MHNKRKTTRQSIKLPLQCRPLKHERISNAQIVETVSRDLSREGLAFESNAHCPLESHWSAELTLPASSERVVGHFQVVRVEPIAENRYLVGGVFTHFEPAHRRIFDRYIESQNFLRLLEATLRSDASDLHLTVGCPPALRVHRRIRFMEGLPELKRGEIEAMIYPLLSDAQLGFFEKNKELNFTFSPDAESRFRVNLHVQKGLVEAAIRNIPREIRNFKQLMLPEASLEYLCRQKSGLVLITGKAGSGKTTTLAAMIDYLNHNTESVIITVEDPIEYLHHSVKSIIKQRELGQDTCSTAAALRNALRQDPDVVVVGELLDADALMEAVTAAETGHLVFATVHAAGTAMALERLVNLFPVAYAPVICKKLAGCLKGILSQILINDPYGGMTLATELLVNNHAVQNVIREGRFEHIATCLQSGAELGMHTMQSSLEKLERLQLIDLDAQAYLKASS